jgi:hypothetical protein
VQACRNAGCDAASGTLLLLLDAGSEVDPTAVLELRDALRHNPEAAYASAWAHGLDPASAPLGNFANFVPEHDNVAVAPLLRSEVFNQGRTFDPNRGPCAGRAFFAGLAADGLFGCVLPKRLVHGAPFSAGCGENSNVGGPSPAREDWMA